MGISCTWAGQFLNTRGARRPGLRIVVTQRRECPASSGARGSSSCILGQMGPPNMQVPIGASMAIHGKVGASPQARNTTFHLVVIPEQARIQDCMSRQPLNSIVFAPAN